ncbi:hypothetical protein H4R19_003338 [Coemansia spiralis]|nr:hypothetical protein H4R19_003338 [Coemansia spiralis]
MVESLLDLLQMCEIHPSITWGVVQQLFCYLGCECFNRILTTREFCSRSQAMQIRLNMSQLSDWVRQAAKRLPVPHQSDAPEDAAVSPQKTNSGDAQTADALLYKAHFSPLVELVELLQCLTHLPDLAEYFETTAKMQHLNVLQQETAAMNYRYELQETRIAPDIVEYLDSVAKEIRDSQRAEREKQSMERASRRSTATVFSERRTMDGRPTMLSLDLAPRTSNGVVRVLADPAAAGAGAGAGASSGTGTTGLRSGRRGLLIPIVRSSARPSVRTLFPGQTATSGRSSIGSRVSESLEPISETASVASRQRSRTTTDGDDALADDPDTGETARQQRLSNDACVAPSHAQRTSSPPPPQRKTMPFPVQQPPRSLSPPNTAPVDSVSGGELSASLRGPRGKKCLPEHMRELLDAAELLPFAVPTSREWLAWWASHATTSARAVASDWSHETVAVHKDKDVAAAHAELVPAIPSEFLHLMSQIA